MPITVYTDGSGKGWICAMIHCEKGYFKTYFDWVGSPMNPRMPIVDFEWQAIILALEKLPETNEEIWLYNDCKSVIALINGKADHNTDFTRHLKQRIRRLVKKKNLNIKFFSITRYTNLAGFLLEHFLKGSAYP